MTDVADDRVVLHLRHVVGGDDVEVAGGGHEEVGGVDLVVEPDDFETFHDRLKGADGVDLGDLHPAALATKALGTALADIAVSADHGDLAGEHDVGRPHDAVDQRMTAAVEVVELALGDRVVDVDRREEKFAGLRHLIEPVDTGRGLFADAADVRRGDGPVVGLLLLDRRKQLENALELRVVGGLRARDGSAGLLEREALVHEQRGVATVVEDEVRALAVRPVECLEGAPPVLFQRLTLPGEDRDALGCVDGAVRSDRHRRGGVVLGREDVAARPTDFRAQFDEGLDEHRGLDGHVEGAGDPGTLQRMLACVLGAERHQPGHFMLGEFDFLAAEGDGLGREIGDLERHPRLQREVGVEKHGFRGDGAHEESPGK